MAARSDTERRLERIERMIQIQTETMQRILERMAGSRSVETAPTVDLVVYQQAIKSALQDNGRALKAYLASGGGVPGGVPGGDR